MHALLSDGPSEKSIEAGSGIVIFPAMKSLAPFLLGTLLVSTGCAPLIDQRNQADGTYEQPKTETELIREDLAIIRQHVEALEQAQITQDLTAPEQARAIASLQSEITELHKQLETLARRQDQQKDEIVTIMSAKMAEAFKKQGGSSRGGGTRSTGGGSYSGPAREHSVQSGETLSAIAQAYGSSVDAIIKANGLGNDGMIRVGQKLVVPVKE